jgi:hypothetical protein
MLIHAHARKHAIEVELFGVLYVFTAHPENPKAFVAEVTDDKAIARLLSIDDAYVEYGAEVARPLPTSHVPIGPADGLTAIERELGFKLEEPSDGLNPEAKAFADAEAARLKAEQDEEAEAIAERNRVLAEAAEREKQEAAEREANAKAAAEAEAKSKAAEAEAAAKFVLKADDGTTVDLKTMDDPALRAFAKDAGVAGLNSRWTGDKLREHIVATLAAPSTPPAE